MNLEYLEPKILIFKNGEQKVTLNHKVTNNHVILFAPITPPVDANFVRTLLTLNSLEHLEAKKITLIIPWLGYSLQNKVFLKGESLSAEAIARSITSKILNEVILLDVHKPEICDMFRHTCKNINFDIFFITKISELIKNKSEVILVGPDNGSQKLIQSLGSELNINTVVYNKQRNLFNGDVLHKSNTRINKKNIAIIIDDGILSGSTILAAAKQLKKDKISTIFVIATHGLLLEGSIPTLENFVDKVFVSNTIPRNEMNTSSLIERIDCSSLIISNLVNVLE